MATWFWINVPLMVLAFALTTGLSYALLLGGRRKAAAPARVAVVAEVIPADEFAWASEFAWARELTPTDELAPVGGSVRPYPAAA